MALPLFPQTLITDRPLVQVMENKDYNYYVGTWRWVDSTTQSELIIKLVLSKTTEPDWEISYLKGAYLYKKDGIVVADYLEELNENKKFVYYPIYIFCDRENNMNLTVRDYLIKNGNNVFKRHGGSSFIKYTSSLPEQIYWKIIDNKYAGVLYTDENKVYPPGISLPEDIILTKVE